jgi:hypothetical protein
MWSVGERVEVAYPQRNVVNVCPEWQRRTVIIKSRRDLMAHPLTPAEFLRRPMVHRGRYLFRVVCLRSNQYRQIYVAASREWRREDVPLRVGLFLGGRLEVPVGVAWGASARDRMGLVKVLEKWRREDFGALTLGVYVDDLRLVWPPEFHDRAG